MSRWNFFTVRSRTTRPIKIGRIRGAGSGLFLQLPRKFYGVYRLKRGH